MNHSQGLVAAALFLSILGGCGAAQMAGINRDKSRDLEINNRGKEPVCSVEIFNPQHSIVKEGNGWNAKVDVKTGEQKTTSMLFPVDQDWQLRIKACSGKVLAEQTVRYAEAPLHIDVP